MTDFLIADIEKQCRPTEMKITNDSNFLIIGSGPLYGNYGGAVSVYDLRSCNLSYTKINVIQNHQIQSIEPSSIHRTCVWLGTSPYGENTNPAWLNEPSHLILWNIVNRSIEKDIIVDEDSKKMPSIVETNGKVFCVTQAAKLVAFDANSGLKLCQNAEAGVKQIIKLHNSKLLGISDNIVFSIDKETLRCDTLAKGFHFLTNLTEDPITKLIYFFDNTNLIQMDTNTNIQNYNGN